ncbi:MAG: DUF3006 domain-containing protein [Clostridia bacterium]|nr:DUF3006 domain-containing protein [Clostridia bacterium]
MKYSVDRIEEAFAVCEDENGAFENIGLAALPENVREGDILLKTDDGYTILADETEERRQRLAKLQKSIFTKNNG